MLNWVISKSVSSVRNLGESTKYANKAKLACKQTHKGSAHHDLAQLYLNELRRKRIKKTKKKKVKLNPTAISHLLQPIECPSKS